ncbi:MAG: hypothetical protein ACFE8G_01930 [Candidatus Hermodarchaeota archaeon]
MLTNIKQDKMKELYEIGIVFRGFILVSYEFKKLEKEENLDKAKKDLRGSFISAINLFARNAFNNLSLEYLEASNILFVFRAYEIQVADCDYKEPIILYGLVDKKKKDTDKFVKKFLQKIDPILNLFISRYANKDFSEITQFESFQKDIREFIFA